jgi:hypothetical protein
MPPLDLLPVRNRLAWALLHASRLKEQVDAWAGEALLVDKITDPTTGRITHRARVTTDPPVDVPLGLSDSLHQARSTLDNMVGVLRGGATTSSAYPVAKTSDAFNQQAGLALQGVPAWAVSVIRRLQPFGSDGWRFIGDGLLRLHDLARADRHRALLLQVGVIDIDEVYVGTAEGAESRFFLSADLRTMTLETTDAHANPHFGAMIQVTEPVLRYPEYPFFPDVTDVAMQTITAVKGVIDMIERAAAEQPAE